MPADLLFEIEHARRASASGGAAGATKEGMVHAG
jgi:hypothetical protein